MHRMTLIKKIGLISAFICMCAGSTKVASAEKEGETTILTTGSYWRAFAMSGPDIIPKELWKEKDSNVKEDKYVSSIVIT